MNIDTDLVVKLAVAIAKALQPEKSPTKTVAVEKDITVTGLSKTSSALQKAVVRGIEHHNGVVSHYCDAADIGFTSYQCVMNGRNVQDRTKKKIIAYDKSLRSES